MEYTTFNFYPDSQLLFKTIALLGVWSGLPFCFRNHKNIFWRVNDACM